jgi:hypothetical protein
MADEYYSIGPELSDIDFYRGGILGSSDIYIESSASAASSKIAFASSSIAISLSNQINSIKFANAQSEVFLSLTKEPSSVEILNILSSIHISADVSSNSSKIAFSSSTSSVLLTNTADAERITTASSSVSISSLSSPRAIRIALALSSSSIASSAGVSTALITLINNSLSFGLRAIVKPPIRFSPNYIDQTSIRSLVILDDKPLTNHNRQFDISLSPINTEIINWNNRRNRYYKRASTSGRKTFSFNWTMLPNGMEDTVDQRNARDFLHTVAEDPDIHELKILNQNESGLTPYTETTYQVFIRSYSESLIRRYIAEGVYLYDCSLVLEEV